jgi:hypothetical protein
MNGTTIEPLVIFKGQNVIQSWIPNEILNKWYFSASSKGWTSNLHGIEWLKRVFELANVGRGVSGLPHQTTKPPDYHHYQKSKIVLPLLCQFI